MSEKGLAFRTLHTSRTAPKLLSPTVRRQSPASASFVKGRSSGPRRRSLGTAENEAACRASLPVLSGHDHLTRRSSRHIALKMSLRGKCCAQRCSTRLLSAGMTAALLLSTRPRMLICKYRPLPCRTDREAHTNNASCVGNRCGQSAFLETTFKTNRHVSSSTLMMWIAKRKGVDSCGLVLVHSVGTCELDVQRVP